MKGKLVQETSHGFAKPVQKPVLPDCRRIASPAGGCKNGKRMGRGKMPRLLFSVAEVTVLRDCGGRRRSNGGGPDGRAVFLRGGDGLPKAFAPFGVEEVL